MQTSDEIITRLDRIIELLEAIKAQGEPKTHPMLMPHPESPFMHIEIKSDADGLPAMPYVNLQPVVPIIDADGRKLRPYIDENKP